MPKLSLIYFQVAYLWDLMPKNTCRGIEKLAVRKNHTTQTTFRTRKLDWKSKT